MIGCFDTLRCVVEAIAIELNEVVGDVMAPTHSRTVATQTSPSPATCVATQTTSPVRTTRPRPNILQRKCTWAPTRKHTAVRRRLIDSEVVPVPRFPTELMDAAENDTRRQVFPKNSTWAPARKQQKRPRSVLSLRGCRRTLRTTLTPPRMHNRATAEVSVSPVRLTQPSPVVQRGVYAPVCSPISPWGAVWHNASQRRMADVAPEEKRCKVAERAESEEASEEEEEEIDMLESAEEGSSDQEISSGEESEEEEEAVDLQGETQDEQQPEGLDLPAEEEEEEDAYSWLPDVNDGNVIVTLLKIAEEVRQELLDKDSRQHNEHTHSGKL